MEASLCATYAPRDPLAEFFRGEISLRKLRVLIEGLPPDCAYVRAVRGDHWTENEWLLRDIANTLRDSIAVNVKVHTGKKINPDKVPAPARRDDEDHIDEEYEEALAAETDALLDRLLAQTS